MTKYHFLWIKNIFKTFAPNLKPTYPVHLTDEHNADLISTSTTSLYKNHFFDYPDTRVFSQVQRDDISHRTAPLRGCPGVRTYHKTDESKVPMYYRFGFSTVTSYQVNFAYLCNITHIITRHMHNLSTK